MRQFAIGDMHGCLAPLRLLDAELKFCSTDTVITLGDYTDRGPDSRGVLDYLIELGSRCRLVPLRGNHDIMMLAARHDPAILEQWLGFGGKATLASYGSDSLDSVPASHWAFLESTRPFYETDREFFVHANAYADRPLSEQPDQMLYWESISATPPLPHQSGRRMICGHTSQKSGQILNLGHAVCIDTYAYGGGWLTGLETGTNVYWQASQTGELRRYVLG